MLEWLRRRRGSRKHPTPQQAYAALSEAACLYAGISNCSGSPARVGLRGEDDGNDVLVCKAHYGRLRKMNDRELKRLERDLVRAFSATPRWT
jgi:hypothetical protein